MKKTKKKNFERNINFQQVTRKRYNSMCTRIISIKIIQNSNELQANDKFRETNRYLSGKFNKLNLSKRSG